MRLSGVPIDDLDEIISRCAPEIEQVLSRNVLITGGSGFVGRWIIESFARVAQQFGVTSKIVSINRSTPPWQSELIRQGLLEVVNADITNDLRLEGQFGYVFHCATPASALLNQTNPLEMRRVIEVGAERVIRRFLGTATRVVNVSSGAVYGVQPEGVQCLDDGWKKIPQFVLPDSAYHHAKVAAEIKFDEAIANSTLQVVHARLFAFLAPLLPLDQHFAAGNFLDDVLRNRPITVAGDGRTIRTYMYGTDLVVWLFAAAVRGISGEAYNIGSPHETTISELADQISRTAGSDAGVFCTGAPNLKQPAHRYVPCTARTEKMLGVQLKVGLEEAIKRTLRWHRGLGKE